MLMTTRSAYASAAASVAAAAISGSRVVTPVPRVDSTRLLGGSHEIVIEHAGQEYRLRLTRNDKLILTK